MSVRVRLVVSGACHPSYSGRQVQLEVPLEQPDGTATTTAHLKNMIRMDWPSDLPEMKETVKTAEMKILKTGNLLKEDTVLRTVFTNTDISECSVGTSAPRDETEPKSVLMHLVFQTNRSSQKRDKDGGKSTDGKKSRESGRRESSGGGCCAVL